MPVPVPPNAKRVYQNKRQEIWEWDQELYDGSHTVYSCLVREDTVAVIPFLDRETILLIKESQPGRSDVYFDVPGGVVDPGEQPEATAKRELREEAGYQGDVLFFRTRTYNGMTRFLEHTFLAKHLIDGDRQHLDAGEK